MREIATLEVGDISLRLLYGASATKAFLWQGPKDARRLADLATELSNPPYYLYGPADGMPGGLIAQQIHEQFGGTLTMLLEEPVGMGYGVDGMELPDGESLEPLLIDDTPKEPTSNEGVSPPPDANEQQDKRGTDKPTAHDFQLSPRKKSGIVKSLFKSFAEFARSSQPPTVNVSLPATQVIVNPPNITNQIVMPENSVPESPPRQEPNVINVTVQPAQAPDVKVEVAAPEVTVEQPAVNIDVSPPTQPINVLPTPIQVTVEPPQVLLQPQITVEQPSITVEAPNIVNQIDVQPAEIKEVKVDVVAEVKDERKEPKKDKVVKIEKQADGRWTGTVEEK